MFPEVALPAIRVLLVVQTQSDDELTVKGGTFVLPVKRPYPPSVGSLVGSSVRTVVPSYWLPPMVMVTVYAKALGMAKSAITAAARAFGKCSFMMMYEFEVVALGRLDPPVDGGGALRPVKNRG